MARISNRTAYAQDADVMATDYLLGSDTDGATKTFSVESLAEYIQDGTVVPDAVPRQFIPVVNQEGTDIEMSLITNIHSGVSGSVDLAFVDPDTQDRRNEIFLSLGQNGQISIIFRNYNDFYYLPSFVDKTFTGNIITTETFTFTGRITDYEGFNVRSVTNTAGTTTYFTDYTFNATLDSTSSRFTDQGDELPQFSSFTTSGLTIVDTEFVGNTVFVDTTVFNDALDVNANIDLSGDLNVASESRIVFGNPLTQPGQVILSTDGSNLFFTGGGNIDIDTNGELTVRDVSRFSEDLHLQINDRGEAPDLIVDGGNIQLHTRIDSQGNETGGSIQRFDSAGRALPSVRATVPNGVEGEDQGLLTSLQLGNGDEAQNWHLLPSTSSVAQVVPGLLEELSPLSVGATANVRTVTDPLAGSMSSPGTVVVLDSINDLVADLYFTLDSARRRITSVNRVSSSITFTPGVTNNITAGTSIPDFQFDTAQFFYGTDRGTEAVYRAGVTTNPASISIPINVTRETIGAVGPSDAATRTLNTNLVAAFGNVPASQRLFFTIGQTAAIPAFVNFAYDLSDHFTDPITITVSDSTNTDTLTYVPNVTGPYDLSSITTATSVTAQIGGNDIPTYDYLASTDGIVNLTIANIPGFAVGGTLRVNGEDPSNNDRQLEVPITDATVSSYPVSGFGEIISAEYRPNSTAPYDLLDRSEASFVQPLGPHITFRYGLDANDAVIVTQGSDTTSFTATAGQTVFVFTTATAPTAVTVNGAAPSAFAYTAQVNRTTSNPQRGALPQRAQLQTGRSFGEELRFVQTIVDGTLSFTTEPANGVIITIQGSNSLEFQQFVGDGTTRDFTLTTFTEASGVVMVAGVIQPTSVYSITRASVTATTVPVLETGQTIFNLPNTFTTPIVRIDVFSPGVMGIGNIPTAQATLLAAEAARDAVSGDVVEGIVFEVTNYDSIDFDTTTPTTITDPGELEFSLLEEGNLQVSSERFTINSELHLPNLPEGDATSQNILFRDPTSGIVSTAAFSSVAGAQSQVRYCPEDDPTDLTNLSEIRFEGSSAAGGIVTVGGGRFGVSTGRGDDNTLVVTRDTASAVSTGGFTSNIIASPGDLIVLGPITSQRIVTLSESTPGASIRFINASTLGTNGNDPMVYDGIWRIVPNSGQRIAGTSLDNTDNDLILNDRTANFDLVYANDQIGWMIID